MSYFDFFDDIYPDYSDEEDSIVSRHVWAGDTDMDSDIDEVEDSYASDEENNVDSDNSSSRSNSEMSENSQSSSSDEQNNVQSGIIMTGLNARVGLIDFMRSETGAQSSVYRGGEVIQAPILPLTRGRRRINLRNTTVMAPNSESPRIYGIESGDEENSVPNTENNVSDVSIVPVDEIDDNTDVISLDSVSTVQSISSDPMSDNDSDGSVVQPRQRRSFEINVYDEGSQSINSNTTNQISEDMNPTVDVVDLTNQRQEEQIPSSNSSNQVTSPILPTTFIQRQSPKNSPPHKKVKRSLDISSEDENIENLCSICYDSYTSVGTHRMTCLKCGHIFGLSCVEKWLKNNKRCPTCNKKSNIKDLRLLYWSNLTVVDNSLVHQLQNDLDKERKENSKIKVELKQLQIKISILNQKIQEIPKVIQNDVLEVKYIEPRFYNKITLLKGNSSVTASGMSKIIIYDQSKKMLLATHQMTGSTLFNGFGYSLLPCWNLSRPETKFHLISKSTIRDAAFHPLDSDVVLLVSVEKMAYLMDVRSGSRICSFQTEKPLWSCGWDVQNPNIFLVGSLNGKLYRFDRRDVSKIKEITIEGPSTGIISIIGIKACAGRGLPRGGYLICKLDAVLALEILSNDEEKFERFDIFGPFMSMSYLPSKNQVLISCRPSARNIYVRHILYTLDQTPDGNPTLSPVQTIEVGPIATSLTRSYIWPDPVDGHTLIYAYDESSNTVCGWSVSDGRKKYSLHTEVPIVDICKIETHEGVMLAALSDKSIHLFKHP